MSNFNISFSHPWVLFLLIAAVLLTLIPHLRIKKKFRRNRNRIVSLVLHLIVLSLTILVLSDIRFNFTLKNDQNEIILLVDVSDSETNTEEKRDETVEKILNYAKFDGYKVGIVRFGFDQDYTVPLTNDVKNIYSQYKKALNEIDTSATNIAAALTYTKKLFTRTDTSKIVLISDMIETDENCLNVIKSISSSGIKVDVCLLDSVSNSNDFQIYDVTVPDNHISLKTTNTYKFQLKSNTIEKQEIEVELYDNGSLKGSQIYSVNKTGLECSFDYEISEYGLHKLEFKIKNDSNDKNNSYSTYINVEEFNKILLVESKHINDDLFNLLSDEGYDVVLLNITTELKENIPSTTDELRVYDQVILNDVSNKDMPSSFVDALYEYVELYGGGLLTVGGSELDGDSNLKSNAYNRDDMYGSKYQSMLPVEAVNYTPPLAIMIVVDTSGSMSNALPLAQKAARATLESLSERDYVGIMTLSTEKDMQTLLEITPRSRESKILAGIDKLTDQPSGGTEFSPAIEASVVALNSVNVAKRHILIISDGQAGDPELYPDYSISAYKKSNITTSILVIGNPSNIDGNDYLGAIESATHNTEGNYYILKDEKEQANIVDTIIKDLSVPQLKEVDEVDFKPSANKIGFSSIFSGIECDVDSESYINYLPFTLGGFNGVKVKNKDYLVISGDYDNPIYAQWKFGNGTVGSLMTDLTNNWSKNIFSLDSGKLLLKNIINTLMPTTNIRSSDINLKITEDNYYNQLSIITDIDENYTIEGKMYALDVNCNKISDEIDNVNTISLNNIHDNSNYNFYVLSALDLSSNYSRCTFIVKKSGLYLIEIKKLNSLGEVVSSNETYKLFSYSKEYNIEPDILYSELEKKAYNVSDKGSGILITNEDMLTHIFDTFIPYINQSYDPRIIFVSIAIVLFLLDIAVRKFKFKWPHELLDNYKKRKGLK